MSRGGPLRWPPVGKLHGKTGEAGADDPRRLQAQGRHGPGQCCGAGPSLTRLRLTTLALVHSTFIGGTDIEGEEWFEPASEGTRNTRSTSDPLNVKRRHGRLELRKNFFTVRVTEAWNTVPSQVKQVRKNGFKGAYAKCRGDMNQ